LRLSFIDIPVPVPAAVYAQATERMCHEVLMRLPGIRAVYQIGSVGTPGISDIDMVAVFDDGVVCAVDPRQGHGGTDAYLFTHHLYGVAAGQMPSVLRYSAFHNYRYLAGQPLACMSDAAGGEIEAIKTQIAIEFLVRMYVNMAQRMAYRLVKLRGFFLQVKAIRYDLEFLGVGGGRLAEITEALIDARERWFTQPQDAAKLGAMVIEFNAALAEFLGQVLQERAFYLPGDRAYQLSPRQVLLPSGPLGWKRSGLRLPAWLGAVSPRFINLQNRLNRFEFAVPARTQALPSPIAERFRLIGELRAYNRRCLPHFAVLTSSLNV